LSSADVEQEAQPEEAPAVDEVREAMVATLRAELGDAVAGHEVKDGDVWVRVDRQAWRRAAEVCRAELACDYFCFLSGIDWMPSPHGTGQKEMAPVDVGESESGQDAATEDTEAAADETPAADAAGSEPTTGDGAWATGYAGGETRFQVFARLYSTTRKVGITLKADLDDDRPGVDSWASIYPGADWHERETWEMYGFDFPGHPGLRHLYLPTEFEGNPLRKDFPLLARMVKPWPGLVDIEPMPEEPEPPADAPSPPPEGEAG
jgi:NADH-quinone oxidoreductase subunit C